MIDFLFYTAPMPELYRKKGKASWPKGVSNRNEALKWIFQYVQESGDFSGALYFADDDNTYDIRLFEEVCKIFREINFTENWWYNTQSAKKCQINFCKKMPFDETTCFIKNWIFAECNCNFSQFLYV